MKIGDKVICVKDLYIEGTLHFLSNRYYYVRDLEVFKDHIIVRVDNYHFVMDDISDLQFGIYFQTLQDFRETRINQILNDG